MPSSTSTVSGWPGTRLLAKLIDAKPREVLALLLAFAYFYCLLCGYYIIRPIRSEMAVALGVENIQWLFTLVLAVMLAIAPIFGWLTSRYRTRDFLAICTLFFASHLVAFNFLFDTETRPLWISGAFYVWTNVFNMFIVSLFWSFMNDIFDGNQAKRLFAAIAAGGTLGAISGPLVTSILVEQTGLANLLLVSAGFLSITIVFIRLLIRWRDDEEGVLIDSGANETITSKGALKGDWLSGVTAIRSSPYLITICIFILLYTLVATFVGIQLLTKVETLFTDPIERTKWFASMDLWVNVLTVFLQLFVTSKLISRFGLIAGLTLIPLLLTIGFLALAFSPVLAALIAMQIARRAGDYAILKPSREMLFSVVTREQKYKTKNFIDTTILRFGDTLSSWAIAGLRALGTSPFGLAMIGLCLGVAWIACAVRLGLLFKGQEKYYRETVR